VFERAKTVHALDRAATVIGTTLHLPMSTFCAFLSMLLAIELDGFFLDILNKGDTLHSVE
jgi:hypothetical protein